MAHCHVNTAHRWALPRPPLLGAGLSRHPGGQTIRWYKGDEATGCGVGCTCGRDSPCCHICGVTLIEAVQRCQGQQQTLCLDWTPANSCLGLDSSVPVPGSDSPQSLLWMVDMMDLIRHVGTLLQCIFCWLLGRGKKTERVSTRPGLLRGSVVMVSTHMELK